jgi:hypothetical protein
MVLNFQFISPIALGFDFAQPARLKVVERSRNDHLHFAWKRRAAGFFQLPSYSINQILN